jgi:hypothetical protein
LHKQLPSAARARLRVHIVAERPPTGAPIGDDTARRSLGGILADAQERGLVGQNVVYSMRISRRSRPADGNGKLKIGIDIPSPAEMRAIVAALAALDAAGTGRCC